MESFIKKIWVRITEKIAESMDSYNLTLPEKSDLMRP